MRGKTSHSLIFLYQPKWGLPQSRPRFGVEGKGFPHGGSSDCRKTPWPPLGGGSARRRWGRELHAGTKVSGKGEALSLRPFGPPLPLWRKRHLPRIGGVCLPEGGFLTHRSLPCQREVDAEGGRRDSDGRCLIVCYACSRARIPPPRYARHLPLTREAKIPPPFGGGYTFYFAPRPAKTTYTVLNKIFTSFQSDQLSM